MCAQVEVMCECRRDEKKTIAVKKREKKEKERKIYGRDKT